jgi:hypothetical protein
MRCLQTAPRARISPLEVSAYNRFWALLSQNATVFGNVNPFCKLLITLAFISQKSLDTPVFWLIRFRQKVLTESKPPLELFSLEEKAAQLPGGLFVSINSFELRF